MEYCAWTILTFSLMLLFGNQVICNINCVQVCDERRNQIDCNQSRILFTDATNLMMERNQMAFENIKRTCMGLRVCDSKRTCDKDNLQTLLVHFVCIRESYILSKECSWQGKILKDNFGYILSPAYPAASTISDVCRWEIEPPEDSKVVVSLHDFATTMSSNDNCDKVFVVRGQSCIKENDASHFCGRNNTTSLTKCGRVQIELQRSVMRYKIRFWISFNILRRDQVSRSPSLHCSSLDFGRDQEGKKKQKGIMAPELTTVSEEISQDSNTEVLVIMLSIISGISAVLLIILIVVCVRCRLLRGASHPEPVYSDPSPSGQVYYEYVSSSDIEKTRPQLVDGYFQVADALPAGQRLEKSTSPPYDEVDRFGHLRKLVKPSSSKAYLKEIKSLNEENKHNRSVRRSTEKQRISDTMEDRCRNGERSKLSEREGQAFSNRISTESKVLPTSSLEDVSLVLPHEDLCAQTNCNDEDNFNSELIGKSNPAKLPSKPARRAHVPNNHSHSGKHFAGVLPKINTTNESYPTNLDMIKNNIKRFSETSNVSQTTQQSPEVTFSGANIHEKTASLSKSDFPSFIERSQTLPGKKSRDVKQEQKIQNIDNKSATNKDMHQTTGIVKNGIKRFEQNGS